MSDRAAIILAVAVWLGALTPHAMALVTPVAVVALALALRRPALFVVGAAVLASALAASAWAGLAPPSGPVVGWATLVGDPERAHGAARVEVVVAGRHYDAWARGPAALVLRGRLAGEVVAVEGRAAPLGPGGRYLRVRHVAGRLDVTAAGSWHEGSLASRLGNRVRRLLDHGARPLDERSRSLLLGLTLGDDRDQPIELADDFRAAGLTHLLAVSGENLAFVLALAGPGLRRLRLGPRWAAMLSLLAFYGLLTRWEPSVLRASAMAAVAVTAAYAGRPVSRLRLLALGVSGVILLDPLVVHAVGFQLSVAATLGITLLAGPIAARLRGPAWLRESMAVTIAAQLGVAPVAIPVFGGIPLASVPANLLAGPAAGPLTMWGLTAGVVAGRLGPPADRVLHWPTRVLSGWLAAVAHWAARLPLGQVRTPHLAVGALLASAWWTGRLARSRRVPSG